MTTFMKTVGRTAGPSAGVTFLVSGCPRAGAAGRMRSNTAEGSGSSPTLEAEQASRSTLLAAASAIALHEPRRRFAPKAM